MTSIEDIARLSAERVQAITEACLFQNPEEKGPEVTVEGVVHSYIFQAERLTQYAEEIELLLEQLPIEFQATEKGGSGGWSFLNACIDRQGQQWGEQFNVEQLMCLGIAIGKVEMLMPKEMWYMLPGGMPYFSVK